MDELKTERTLIKAKATKQRLADIEQAARQALDDPVETVPLDRLITGDAVELVGLGKVGTLLESPQDKKRIRVRVGDTEVSVVRSGLRGIARGSAAKAGSAQARPHLPRYRLSGPPADGGATPVLDLRGKMPDEAIELTVAALDQAALIESPLLRIIHGHGTGRLKTVIRDYLRESPYVACFRAGERAEGGDGVTIVELR
jgi:DNA mismatch repair protein MutS2